MSSGDKRLFTPGPLTTSEGVKRAMLRDLGSRDREFVEAVAEIRDGLLRVAGTSRERDFEAVPIQGSGTFALEAVVSSVIPQDGALLVLVNGAYGERIRRIAEVHGIPTAVVRCAPSRPIEPEAVERAIADHPSLTHVAVVHCETTSGVMNPIEAIGGLVAVAGLGYVVDAMSSFGGVPLNLEAAHIDYLVSSANKCIEGVPGFGFVIARRDALVATEGFARTVSLDLFGQWRGLEGNGQFRFTPPTHALLAFRQALAELDAEGGVEGRAARYRANREIVRRGMAELGFREYVATEHAGHVISSFAYPDDPAFDFDSFYERLSERGFVIYPGKLTDADCFRIGHIGRLTGADSRELLAAIRAVLAELGVTA